LTWKTHRPAILADWMRAHPGSRPFAWWVWDAPEKLRRRVGGIGTARADVLAMEPEVRFGIDVSFLDAEDVSWYTDPRDIHGKPVPELESFRESPFEADAFDPADPPRFESQAAYLARHGLLTADERERLPKAAFAPEAITDVIEVAS
jgi:hypothetical protein